MFINLNAHSYYSILSSSMSIDDIVNFAVRNKQTCVALVDINNLHGAPEFFKKAKAANLTPIIGIQTIYKEEKIILLARDNVGYKNIVKISSKVMTNEVFNINEHAAGITLIVRDCDDLVWNDKFAPVFSYDQSKCSPIAIHEVFCETESDAKYFYALRAIGTDQILDESKETSISSPFWLLSQIEAKKTYSPESLDNLAHVIKTCVGWDLYVEDKINFVKFDKNKSSKILLQSLCKEGLKFRIGANSAPDIYIERLKKELEIIDSMNFNDYFLVVHDYVTFAKNSNILVGPGRGSAAGSLVSYVLGITDVDPITNNLIFERFLNPERKSMPDIDIDFMDSRRNEIFEYVFNKYGNDHTSHILTFQRIKAKMAIRDVGRILGIDIAIINAISKSFTMDYDMDISGAIKDDKNIASYAKKYPELFDIAAKIINFPRQIGVHAAGVLITNTPTFDIIPIMAANDGTTSTQFSMEYLEELGLIKMDILGLVNLTTIGDTISLIRYNRGIEINLSKIPFNDKLVFTTLARGDTTGIFQLESPGMRNLITKIKPKDIEDISITSALFRPGPQKNIPTYLANKENPGQIVYINDDFKDILGPTYNVMIYQEQVIQIVRKVTNHSLAKADSFRQGISKKDADILEELKIDFMKAGLENHYGEEELKKIFEYIFNFANYGFNHSHSLAYSYLSYWMAYLKAHYPLEFYTVLLCSNDSSVDKVAIYINSAKEVGINIIAPSLNYSNYGFSTLKNDIVFGFNAIAGIGRETINRIIAIRNQIPGKKFTGYVETIGRLTNGGIGQKVIETLIKSGCLDEIDEYSRHFMMQNLLEVFEKSKTMLASGKMIIQPILKNVPETAETKRQMNSEQFALLGVSFEEHPLVKVKANYKGEYKVSNLLDVFQSQEVDTRHSIVILKSHRERIDKNGNAYAMASIEDDTKIVDVVIFSSVYNKVKNLLQNDKIILVGIRPTNRGLQLVSVHEVH